MNYSSKPVELEIIQERITLQIGRGKFSTLTTPVTDTATANRKVHRADSLVLALNPAITDTAAQLSYLSTLTNHPNTASSLYFYHPDHLGSSSWITYSDGSAVQHLYYLPWGEDFVDQRSTSWNSMYTFSAKEKDTETGYSYFGSRYYSSDLSIRLSVDPMAAKYPSLSPYVYCANNPLKYIDPNGEAITPETAWDIINVVMGAASFTGNVVSGNILGAAVDAIGLLYDAVATAIPFLPGGASGCVGLVRFVKVTKNLYNSIGKIKNLTCFKKNEKLLSLANKAQNALTENLKIDDIAGAVQDILGIPVKKGGSATYDHLQEVTSSLKSLTNYKRELQSVLNKSNNLSEQEIKVINASIRETNAHITRVEKILKKAKEVKEL